MLCTNMGGPVMYIYKWCSVSNDFIMNNIYKSGVNKKFKFIYPILLLLETRSRDKLLRQALFKDKRIITIFSEIAYNILKGNIELNKRERRLLSGQKNFLTNLVQKGKYESKYRMLTGVAGQNFLAVVIPIILPAIEKWLGP